MMELLPWTSVNGITAASDMALIAVGLVLVFGGMGIISELVLRELGVDQARPLIYGAILIVTVQFLPEGLESLGPKLKGFWARRRSGAPVG